MAVPLNVELNLISEFEYHVFNVRPPLHKMIALEIDTKKKISANVSKTKLWMKFTQSCNTQDQAWANYGPVAMCGL